MNPLRRLATWLVSMAIVLVAGCGSGSSAVQPTASPDAWRLVTIGDSIPYGQADCGACDTFTTIFGKWIASATGKPGVTLNLATHDNLTGARLLGRVKTDHTFRDAVASAVYRSFNGQDGRVAAGDLLADDHTHPSAKGHARIAQLLTEAGLRPLS